MKGTCSTVPNSIPYLPLPGECYPGQVSLICRMRELGPFPVPFISNSIFLWYSLLLNFSFFVVIVFLYIWFMHVYNYTHTHIYTYKFYLYVYKTTAPFPEILMPFSHCISFLVLVNTHESLKIQRKCQIKMQKSWNF